MFLPTENDTFLQCTLKEDGLYAENVNAMLESTTESKLLTMDSLKNLALMQIQPAIYIVGFLQTIRTYMCME